MIRNTAVARQISELMIGISGQLDRSIVKVKTQCSAEEFEAYKHAVGRILGDVLLEVLNPLYAEHPSLKPPQMD
jgi:hypothetical protein